ncbi:MAG TPA: OsmC family protein [Sphingobacteriaceae bacterium]
MIRKSTAIWSGGKDGRGQLSSTSGVLQDTPYSFSTRFENEEGKAGTNPEELIAAAHAGCFSMAFSFALAGAGFTAEQVRTEAAVKIEKSGEGFAITSIHLTLEGKVPGVSAEKFEELAQSAKQNCPVSKALQAVDISLDARLV